MLAFPKPRSRIEIAEWRAWLPGVVENVVVALLALQVARLGWLALTPVAPGGDSANAAATATVPASPPSLPTIDVFFRNATVGSSGTGEALGYRLFGVRKVAGDGGSAILGKDGEQASYAVGREVAPGIRLASIGKEHVVLAANGARHRLDLPQLATTDRADSRPAALPTVAPPKTSSATLATALTEGSTAAPTTPRPTSPSIAQASAAGDGYTITPGVRAAMLRPTGLRPGDVVLSVNGRPVDPARLAGLQDELKGQAQLTIQYRRDGKTHTATVRAPR